MATRSTPPGNYMRSRGSRWDRIRAVIWWIFRLVNLTLLTLIAAGAGVLLGSYSGIAQVVPKISELPTIQPGSGSRIVSADGVTLATLSTENRQYVPLEKIPIKLQEAVIATEDRDFYRHIGVDPRGIARAVYADIRAGGTRQGGSTITQQLARNLYLTPKRTISRKLAEMVLAVQIERAYTKPEILEIYLNQICFGEGAYGVQVAAKTYFRKNVWDLDIAQCAMLAGLIRRPEYYSPFEDEVRAKERRDKILSLMKEERYLTPEEAAQCKEEPLNITSDHRPLARSRYLAPWFVTYVIKDFEAQYGPDALYKGNYIIHTTLNYEMQKAAEEAVRLGIEKAGRFGAEQMALVTVDTHTGAIKAMVGGANWDKSQYNIAAQGDGRQTGSAFKPFVYMAALLQGYTPESPISNASISFPSGSGGRWTPHNYDSRRSGGMMTLRTALYFSQNLATVRLASQIGILSVIDVAEKMGIPKLKMPPYLPTSIGAASITPLQMASAFSIFATKGMRTEPYVIAKIVDPYGRTVDEHQVVTWRVLDESIANSMVSMMQDVILRGTAGGIAGMIRGKLDGAAGKTGTSSDFKDAWFVGYTPDLSTAVWTGKQNYLKGMRSGATGGTLCAPVWANFMLKAQPIMAAARTSSQVDIKELEPQQPRKERPKEKQPSVIPPEYLDEQNDQNNTAEEGRVEVSICPDSGLRAGPNCPAPVLVGYDLRAGDKPPEQTCDIHTGRENRAPERANRVTRPEPTPSGNKVTLPVCAITKKLATEYCPVIQNMTFDENDVPTETCTRHGRR